MYSIKGTKATPLFKKGEEKENKFGNKGNEDLSKFINAMTKFKYYLTNNNIPLYKVPNIVTNKAIKSIGRSSLTNVHVPIVSTFDSMKPDQGDLHATPMGIRMIYDQWRNRYPMKWFEQWVTKYFPKKIWPVVLAPFLDHDIGYGEPKANLLKPRGFHAVYDSIINIPYYTGSFSNMEWKGLGNHVLAYGTKRNMNDEFLIEFDRLMNLALENMPLPKKSWYDSLVDGNWRSSIRLESNSGNPYFLRQSAFVAGDKEYLQEVEEGQVLRDWLFEQYFSDVILMTNENWPKEVIYALFYRSQWGKDRAVCGAPAFLKVFGAAINTVMLQVFNINNSPVAWGSFEDISNRITAAIKSNLNGSMISSDFSGLDQCFHQILIKRILKYLGERWGTVDPVYKKVMEYADYCMTDGAYLQVTEDKMIKVENGMLSGTPLTQILDSLLMIIFSYKLQEMSSSMDSTICTLGDDMSIIGNKDLINKFPEWVDWLKLGGFEVSLSKSYPCLVRDGFTIFLQYVYYVDEDIVKVVGNLGRRVCSLALRERDSSLLRGIDLERFLKVEKLSGRKVQFKYVWLLRTLQVIATLIVNNMHPKAVTEFLSFVSKYEKYILDINEVKKALSISEDFGNDEEFWHVNIDPKTLIPYLEMWNGSDFNE